MKLAAAFLLGFLFAAYANWWRELLTNLHHLPRGEIFRASGAKGDEYGGEAMFVG